MIRNTTKKGVAFVSYKRASQHLLIIAFRSNARVTTLVIYYLIYLKGRQVATVRHVSKHCGSYSAAVNRCYSKSLQ